MPLCLVTLNLSTSNLALAAEKTYIREYTYQASDTDSKVSARNKSLLFIKQNLLSEIGSYVGSAINIVSISNGSQGNTAAVQQIRSITEGFIKTEIIEQKWNGVSFYVKAKLKADPDKIAARLKEIYGSKQANSHKSSEEFNYWKSVVQVDSKAGYLDYMSKYPNGKYHDLAKIAIDRLSKQKASQFVNPDWLIKQPGKVTIVVRHDTGWFDDLDPDVITQEMGQTVKTMYQKFMPPKTQFNLITRFDQSEVYKFNYKNQSKKECQQSKSQMIVGAMLNDYDGSDGKYRPIKLFIYDCVNASFKLSSFVPKVNSPKAFWRERALKKNLRVFVREYLDTI